MLAGSHKMGRFDHVLVTTGGPAQRGAELDRVNWYARAQLEHIQVRLGHVED